MDVSKDEIEQIRNKPLMYNKHFYARMLYRTDFNDINKIFQEGIIEKEGKNKYRASVQVDNKIVFVIFETYDDFNLLITIGITSKKK